jgi:hypothetical protein
MQVLLMQVLLMPVLVLVSDHFVCSLLLPALGQPPPFALCWRLLLSFHGRGLEEVLLPCALYLLKR